MGPAAQRAWWAGLGALLANVGAYYGQFAPAVQATLKDGLAPLEKQLQDFVRLASWEDRGYYAMRASTEKAQRHLHRLTRNAAEVLKSPAAATVVAAARGAGLDDLKATDAPSGSPATGKPARRRAAARSAKAPAAGKLAQAIASAAVENGGSSEIMEVAALPETAADLATQTAEEVQREARLAWVAFSAAAAAGAQTPLAAEPAAEAAAEVAEGGQYLHRLPALAQRLGGVLQGALYAEPAADTPLIEGGLEVDGAAAAAAERALALRSLTDKGARARKKAALTGLLQGLAALGVSRRRSAVPPAERSAQSWFRQALPQLEHTPLLETVRDNAAASPAAVGAAADAWQSAGDYYLRSIGRIQRLWEAAKAPHHDLSAAEVESAVRLSEHLLHLQRLQRRSLAAAAARHADVAALAAGLAELAAAPDALPPQGVTREWAAQQRAQLDTLWLLATDTHTLLIAAADTEPNAAAKAKLQTAAAHVATLVRVLEAARIRWASQFESGGISAHVDTAAAAAALDANAEDLRASHAALAAADLEADFANSVPAWSPLLDAMAAATASSTPAVQSRVTALQQQQQQQLMPSADDAGTSSVVLQGVDAVVEQVLLWGQTVAAAQSAWAAPPAEGDNAPADHTIGQRWAHFEACAGLARLAGLQESVAGLLSQLSAQADEPGGDSAAVTKAAQALGSLAPLLRLAAGGLQALALQALPLHRATAKLGYVITALFSGLVEQGFCMPDATREGEGGEGEGKFTEAEGTGLGDADTTGARDVSDQIGDQDQLLGSRQKDAPPEEPQPQQDATGPEEEQPQGVEMEDDFEGELQDVPEGERQEQEDEEGEEGDEERLDQQMGDGGEGEQVVDERMWGEDEDKPRDADAKYEKDAPVQVDDKTDLEYQAGQDDAEEGGNGDDKQQQKPADGSKPQEQPQPEGGEGGDVQEEELPEQGDGMNEDTADKYEDRQHAQPEGPPEDFELPEDMQLDGEGDGGGEDEDGLQEGEEVADAPEQGGAMPEAEPQERQPQPAEGDEGGGEDMAAEADEGAAEPEDGAEMEGGPEQGGGRPDDADEEEAGKEERDDTEGPGGGEDAEADTAADQQQLPEAGPQGQASAAVQAAAAVDGAGAGAEDEAQRDEAAGAGAQQQGAPQGAEAADAQQAAAGAAGAGGGAQRGIPQRGAAADGRAAEQQPHGKPLEANPLRGLGSALERWRARLAVRSDAPEPPQDGGAAGGEQDGGQPEGEEGDAEFQYMHEDEQPTAGDTQALGAATEEQAAQLAAGLDRPEHGDEEMADMAAAEEAEPAPEAGGQLPQRQAAAVRSGAAGDSLRAAAEVEDMDSEEAGQTDGDAAGSGEQEAGEDAGAEGGQAGEPGASFISSRLAALEVAEGGEAAPEAPDPEQAARLRADLQAGLLAHAEAAGAAGDAGDLAAGAAAWARCEALTAGLAGELAEQLRLILEPTVASRLAGDFRSGKRINMKKVIAFIASHFRRDKIWMRRTHPDKRKYQVVIAVDDSRSMGENGCGAVALEAVTLIARALARLEVGELGVLRFGGTSGVATLHELGRPFSDAEGPGLLAGLRFDADNTLADTPMVGLLSALGGLLDSARERASSGAGFGSEALQQLVLVVADGRFHEKAALQRAVREASERRGVLIAFIILDNPAASLLDMRNVSFVDGKPAFAQYLDTFPFPFYVVLRDIAALPATLADLLRQWFHLHAGQ